MRALWRTLQIPLTGRHRGTEPRERMKRQGKMFCRGLSKSEKLGTEHKI